MSVFHFRSKSVQYTLVDCTKNNFQLSYAELKRRYWSRFTPYYFHSLSACMQALALCSSPSVSTIDTRVVVTALCWSILTPRVYQRYNTSSVEFYLYTEYNQLQWQKHAITIKKTQRYVLWKIKGFRVKIISSAPRSEAEHSSEWHIKLFGCDCEGIFYYSQTYYQVCIIFLMLIWKPNPMEIKWHFLFFSAIPIIMCMKRIPGPAQNVHVIGVWTKIPFKRIDLPQISHHVFMS